MTIAENDFSQQSMKSSPGSILREMREDAGLTLDDISRSLNLDKNIILQLEADDADGILPVFFRGYQKAYIHLLNSDEQLVLGPQELHHPKAASKVTGGEKERVKKDHRWRIQAVGALVALALIIISAWWLTRPAIAPFTANHQTKPLEKRGGSVDHVIVKPNPIKSTLPATAGIMSKKATSGGQLQRVKQLFEKHSAIQMAMPSVNPSIHNQHTQVIKETVHTKSTLHGSSVTPLNPGSKLQLQSHTNSQIAVYLKFIHPSWVQIRGQTGKTLLIGLFPGGGTQVVKGIPPFQIVLGNASAVVMEINGKNINISHYIRVNHTAHFTLTGNGKTTH